MLRSTSACLEEVRFLSGDLELAGQWFTPPVRAAFPTIVMIRGSGESSRGNPWTEMLAAALLEEGVAVLIPDKRGSGASEGDWRAAHFSELADDALAAVRFARSRPDVDEARVGLMGLSQGGQIAPVAAAGSSDVAFVVSVVGSAVPFLENVRFEMLQTFEEEGLSGAEFEAASRMLDAAGAYIAGSLSWETYGEAHDRARDVLGDDMVERYFIGTPDHWRWDFFRRHADFDPIDSWPHVEQPALVLLGAEDRNTPTAETAARIQKAFEEAAHTEGTIRVFDGLGHDLIDHAAPGPMSEHGLHPEVRRTLASWVRRIIEETP